MAVDDNPPIAERVWRRFLDGGGGSRGAVLCFAPGRLNLIGAHLDYSGGDVLPLAVDLGVYAAARLRSDRRLVLTSLDRDPPVEIEIAAVGATADPSHGWANYPIGVWRKFAERTGRREGVDLVFGGDLPMASGMSSSAAIEVATAFALNALHGTGSTPVELARIAHRAETEFVGIACGIMDQFASALGRQGHALLLHCHDERWEHVPMDPARFEVLVMDTKKPRGLAATGFNERVRECALAHRRMRELVRDLPFLAAYSEADLERAAGRLEPLLWKRVRHVVREMGRVAAAVASLRRGDIADLGAQLDRSHRSASEDYEVSCDELDAITAFARDTGAAFGARLTGAGFGGCALALVQPGRTHQVAELVSRRFEDRFGVRPAFSVLHAGDGPRRLR
jgi:galactokinase